VFYMPGFDGTGPRGEGPMTGGGFGYCGAGWRAAQWPRGRGFFGRFGAGPGVHGFARGFGRAYGPAYPYSRFSPGDTKTELADLQEEERESKAYLKDLEARIGELTKGSE
jgi:hypothetical protein